MRKKNTMRSKKPICMAPMKSKYICSKDPSHVVGSWTRDTCKECGAKLKIVLD